MIPLNAFLWAIAFGLLCWYGLAYLVLLIFFA